MIAMTKGRMRPLIGASSFRPVQTAFAKATAVSPKRAPEHMPQPREASTLDAGIEASRCVSCHMPRIMEALLFPARSHEIDDVPEASMTERFGHDNSPNACLTCHRDRGVAWLREKMDTLFGEP